MLGAANTKIIKPNKFHYLSGFFTNLSIVNFSIVNLLTANFRILSFIVSLFILTSFSAHAEQKLRIAAAANFAPVLEKLLPQFTQQTGIKTQLVSGASGTLYQQIYHGAPFDIFLSADSLRAQQLERDKLIVANSRSTYAYGEIAFYSATDVLFSIEQLRKVKTKVAIANPDLAPYGKAAKQALVNLSLWQPYQGQLIRGMNINQTFQQVRSKAVKLGVVAKSQLMLNNLTGLNIPSNYYRPIEQQLVIVKRSKQQENAERLRKFLLSEATQQKISQYGYRAIHSPTLMNTNND